MPSSVAAGKLGLETVSLFQEIEGASCFKKHLTVDRASRDLIHYGKIQCCSREMAMVKLKVCLKLRLNR